MAVSATDRTRTASRSTSIAATAPGAPRRPLRDNPGLILVLIGLLLAALVAMVGLADRSAELSPDFLTEVVLYALSAADLTMLLALGFVLARNVIKLVVERRHGLPFARFRSKLVLLLLGMTLVPALLVLLVGSEVIRQSAERWFSAPIDQVLTSAREIATDYYREREGEVANEAQRIATVVAATDFGAAGVAALRDAVAPAITSGRVSLVEIYRIEQAETPRVVPVVDIAAPALPRGSSRAVADRLASQVAAGQTATPMPERLPNGGELVRAAALVRGAGGQAVGVVLASDYLTGGTAQHSRRIIEAYEGYQQLRVLKRPLEGVYLSFFLMMTLLILVGSTWMGLYLTKRVTRPIQALAAGARELGAGHLDHRIEPETRDEFGSLIEAFNAMADDLATSQRRLERSRVDLERKNLEVEGRRRYIEAILQRIATGVVSIDAAGRISTLNGAAGRLLRLGPEAIGAAATDVFAREDLAPLGVVVNRAVGGHARGQTGQEVMLTLDGHELYLAVATTPLGTDSTSDGLALVIDDVTPLIRAQKVAAWRDVARRLAHEVKNPLTPIQLCAERLRRHFAGAPEPARRLVDECSGTIVQEVESLKLLVDEFSQFARMPAPKTAASDLNVLIGDALSLYRGLFNDVSIETALAADLPRARVDPEQFRRVILNLVDNAIEALEQPGGAPAGETSRVIVETAHDGAAGVVRVVVADNGPGVPEADRGRLFMPYYSTKRRGSGLGLAIVRRIVVEHEGSIEARANAPRGTRMTIELPV